MTTLMPAKTQHARSLPTTRHPGKLLLHCSSTLLLLAMLGIASAEPTATSAIAAPIAAGTQQPAAVPSPGERTTPVEAEPTGPKIATALEGSTLPTELSAMQMFRDADWVVKSVMLLLIGASVMSWTIAIAKSIELSRYRKLLLNQNARLGQTANLASANNDQALNVGSAAQMVELVQDEISRSTPASNKKLLPITGIKERAISRLSRLEAQQAHRFATGTGPLASIGATAPFIGLFGTVWGIMNAFIGISQSHTTNLAVVAPGIAEALLATALGLVAAIPAVLIYNHFSRRITALRAMLGDQSALVLQLLSRDLDRLQATRPAQSEPIP